MSDPDTIVCAACGATNVLTADQLDAIESAARSASPVDRAGHVHEWTDAPDDETGWYCPGCGATEYPGMADELAPNEASGVPAANVSEGLREALTEWQRIATDYSDAISALGGHAVAKHQSPEQYDSDSGLACIAPGCRSALARSTPAGLDADRLAKVLAIVQPTIYHVQDKDWRPYADRIAAEYARLSQPDATEEAGRHDP